MDSQLWQISLNIRKCASLTCCRKPPSFPTSYLILSQLLQHVTEHPYLGVVIDSKMSFSSHIDHITLKATRMLNFIKRNLFNCLSVDTLSRNGIMGYYRGAVAKPESRALT